MAVRAPASLPGLGRRREGPTHHGTSTHAPAHEPCSTHAGRCSRWVQRLSSRSPLRSSWRGTRFPTGTRGRPHYSTSAVFNSLSQARSVPPPTQGFQGVLAGGSLSPTVVFSLRSRPRLASTIEPLGSRAYRVARVGPLHPASQPCCCALDLIKEKGAPQFHHELALESGSSAAVTGPTSGGALRETLMRDARYVHQCRSSLINALGPGRPIPSPPLHDDMMI